MNFFLPSYDPLTNFFNSLDLELPRACITHRDSDANYSKFIEVTGKGATVLFAGHGTNDLFATQPGLGKVNHELATVEDFMHTELKVLGYCCYSANGIGFQVRSNRGSFLGFNNLTAFFIKADAYVIECYSELLQFLVDKIEANDDFQTIRDGYKQLLHDWAEKFLTGIYADHPDSDVIRFALNSQLRGLN